MSKFIVEIRRAMSSFTIVRSNRLNMFGSEMCEDVQVVEMFDMASNLKRIIIEICLKLHIKMPKYFFNQDLLHIQTDTIIVFDGHARPEFLEWLVKGNPGKRFIFWCWNSIKEIENNLRIKDIPDKYELWSYSEHDCETYKIKHNTTFYWNTFQEKKKQEEIYDLYFIGKDKGRYNKIKKLEKDLSSCGVRCFIQIMPTHFLRLKKGLSKRITYREALDNMAKSKSILDISVSPTAGPSLRPIEAAYYQKKLITDNIEVKNMKFYNNQNICVIGAGGV